MKNKFTKRAMLMAMACMVPAMAMAAPAINNPDKDIAQVMPKAKMSLHNEFTGTQSDAKLGKFTLAEIEINLDPSMEEKINVEDILPMTTPYVEKEITINELNELMAKISMYCRSKGFAAATCYLPEQKAKYAIIHLDVIPGKYGQVHFENNSSLSDSALEKYARKLKAGKVITTRDLESVLRNISDVGGIDTATGVLTPGAEVGTSDVTIRVNDGKQVNTIVYVDNYGSEHTGRYHYGFQTNINRISSSGTNAKIGGMISNGDQKSYYAAVESPVGNGETVIGVSIGRSNYEVYDAVDVKGKSDSISVYGKTNLVNAVDSTLKVNYGVDYRKLKDEYTFGTTGLDKSSEKHTTSVHLGVEGSHRAAGSYFDYDLTGYFGNATPNNDYTRGLMDQVDSEGNYVKGVLNAKYVQSTGHMTDVMLKVQGQMASHNLDTSEKMVLGGPRAIRAYASGEASGDQGVVGTMEFRYHAPLNGLVFSTYLDAGTVNQYHNYTNGNKTLMGWGLGVTYSKVDDWFARFDYARRIGGGDNLSPSGKDKQRLWFTLGKLF